MDAGSGESQSFQIKPGICPGEQPGAARRKKE
nr:MAG TPA: hypothetical protein [Caudoviricetes sp.]